MNEAFQKKFTPKVCTDTLNFRRRMVPSLAAPAYSLIKTLSHIKFFSLPSGPATRSFNGLHPKSKFLASTYQSQP